jgi:CYTH domain-containing protein
MSKEFKKIFIIKDYTKVKISEEFINLEQFYLCISPRIRCRKLNDVYTIATKIKVGKSEKIEFSSYITEREYNQLKENRISKIVTKERHDIKFDNEIGLYDIFSGDFDLKIASMEFKDYEEMMNFNVPDYLEEVGDLVSEEDMKR